LIVAHIIKNKQPLFNKHCLKTYQINIGASAGLALCTDTLTSADELVELADKAL